MIGRAWRRAELVSLVLGALAAGAVTGCGSAASSSCPSAVPCGGDIVGAWTITSSCWHIDQGSFLPFSCPTEIRPPQQRQLIGNVTYNADLTFFESETLVAGVVVESLPPECLAMAGDIMNAGRPLTCAELNDFLSGSPSFTCRSQGALCVCTAKLPGEASGWGGTYTTTAAGLLTETLMGASPEESDYCVHGDTMTQSPRPDPFFSTAPPGSDTFSGMLMFTRQP